MNSIGRSSTPTASGSNRSGAVASCRARQAAFDFISASSSITVFSAAAPSIPATNTRMSDSALLLSGRHASAYASGHYGVVDGPGNTTSPHASDERRPL
jgi:hypothetical protein